MVQITWRKTDQSTYTEMKSKQLMSAYQKELKTDGINTAEDKNFHN